MPPVDFRRFVIYAKRLHQHGIPFSDFILCGFAVDRTAVGHFTAPLNITYQIRLPAHLLRKIRKGCTDTVIAMCIASSETRLVIPGRQTLCRLITLFCLARIKCLDKIKFPQNLILAFLLFSCSEYSDNARRRDEPARGYRRFCAQRRSAVLRAVREVRAHGS